MPPDELVGVHAVGHPVAARREDDVDGADGERVPEALARGRVAPGLERERRVAVRGDGVGLVVRGNRVGAPVASPRGLLSGDRRIPRLTRFTAVRLGFTW